MERNYIEEKTFEKIDYTATLLARADYENCHFNGCEFSQTDLSGINFIECTFNGCNLSMARLGKTSFRDVLFKDCKMLGLHFEQCDQFLLSARFENCLLNLSSFYRIKLKKTAFKNCTLHEADLTEADFSGTIFDHCDFSKAVFEHTILEKADLRSAYNYSIDPELNQLKKARFSLAGVAGLLDKYNISIE